MVLHFQNAGVCTQPGCAFISSLSQTLFWDPDQSKPLLFSVARSILGLLLKPRLHLHQCCPVASFSVKAQLFPMTPLSLKPVPCVTLPHDQVQLAASAEVQPRSSLAHSFCGMTLKKHFPEEFTSWSQPLANHIRVFGSR